MFIIAGHSGRPLSPRECGFAGQNVQWSLGDNVVSSSMIFCSASCASCMNSCSSAAEQYHEDEPSFAQGWMMWSHTPFAFGARCRKHAAKRLQT